MHQVIEIDSAKVHILDIDIRSNSSITEEEIQELAQSIKVKGQLAPALVREHPDKPGEYVIIAGKRRTLATQLLKIPLEAYVVADDDTGRRVLALTENLQRKDMNAIDIAVALSEALEGDPNLDQQSLARQLGVSAPYISQHLAMLKLPKDAQKLLRNGRADFAQARQLNRLSDHPEAIAAILDKLPTMTASQLEKYTSEFLVNAKVQEVQQAEVKEAADIAAGKAPAKKKRTAAEDEAEEKSKKPSLIEQYSTAKFKPRTIEGIRTALVDYAGKWERAHSDEKKNEYKWILKGIEIAANLES